MEETRLAVNGILMRGQPLNGNLLSVGAKFVREDRTAPFYRLWLIDERYPAMLRDKAQGAEIQVEIWKISESGVLHILASEPAGLCIGKIELQSGNYVLGVLVENFIVAGREEITRYGGWRNYLANARAG